MRFKSYKIGRYELPNRVFMAPMTRSHANNPENVATPLIAEYYAQRASAGLLITEGSQVSKQGVGYINTRAYHSQAQVEGWKQVTQAAHDKNGHIFCQLWHCGRMSILISQWQLPVAPPRSTPRIILTQEGFKDTVTPHALTVKGIHEIIEDFKKAAENAIALVLMVLEIHSANGYLFISSSPTVPIYVQTNMAAVTKQVTLFLRDAGRHRRRHRV